MPEGEVPTAPTERTGQDGARSIVIGLAGSVPVAGAILTTIVESLWVDPYRARITAFAEAIAREVAALQIALDQIPNVDLFHTVAARAVQAATRTHEAEKLQMLRNAVVNVALGIEPNQIWSLLLMDFVDELSEAHLVALQFLNDPVAGRVQRGLHPNPQGVAREGHVAEILGVEDRTLVDRLLRDLDQRQLAFNSGSFMMRGQGTSETGKRLLRFITDRDIPEEP